MFEFLSSELDAAVSTDSAKTFSTTLREKTAGTMQIKASMVLQAKFAKIPYTPYKRVFQ